MRRYLAVALFSGLVAGQAMAETPKVKLSPAAQKAASQVKAELPCVAPMLKCADAAGKNQCINPNSDVMNCGKCGNACPGEKAVCNNGHCDYAD